MKQFFRLFPYAKPYLPKLILGFFLVVLVGQSALFMPFVTMFLIDTILKPSNAPLASVDLAFRDDLDNQARLSNALREQLESQGISFSSSTVVSTENQGEKWSIHDTETGQKYRISQQVFQLDSDFQKKRYLEKLEGVTDIAEFQRKPVPSEGLDEATEKSRKELAEASKKLHTAFEDRNILLSKKTVVSAEEVGSHWLVIDRATGKQHTIWKENGKLYAAEDAIKVYTTTIAYSLLGYEFHYTLIDWLIILLCIIITYYAIFGVVSFLSTYVMTWVSQRLLFDLRNKVFSHLQSLSMQFYESQGTGQILSRVREDVASLRNLATETTIQIVTQAVTFVLMLGTMLYLNWKLALFALMVFPLIIGNYHIFIQRLRPMWRQWRHKWADIGTGMYEAVAGAKVVKAFHRERHHERQLFHNMRETLESRIKIDATQMAMGRVALFFRSISRAAVLCYGGYLVIQGDFTVGSMILFYSFVERLQEPIMTLIRVNTRIQEAMISAERVFGLLDSEPTVEESSDAITLPRIRGHVKFEDVSFHYEPENPVLHNIDLEAKPGMMVALVGPSGCGKTTIANLISRFYDPVEGNIFVDEYNLRDVSIKSLRNQMGIVLQDNFLFAGSVAENIRFGKLGATDEEVVQAALAANAHQFIVDQLPEGYETEVGERGMRLSGGQKQRIAIARTILRDPRILILDEATSNLDTESESQIQEALDRLMQSRTSFVIAHRLSTILNADMIIALKEGKIVEIGTHEQLLTTDGMYADMYNKQFKNTNSIDDNSAWAA